MIIKNNGGTYMHRVLLARSLLILSFISITSLAQSKTWENTYHDLGDFSVGYQIQFINDELIIAGSSKNQGADNYRFILAKTDTNGNLIWNTTLGNSHIAYKPTNKLSPFEIITEDINKIAVTYSKASGDTFCVSFAKFSMDGELLIEKTLTEVKEGFGVDIEIADNGSFFIAAIVNGNRPALLKLNPNGDLLWVKYFEPIIGFDYRTSVHIMDDENLLFANGHQLLKINAAGDSLAAIELDFFPLNYSNGNDAIYISGMNYYAKVYDDLNLEWSHHIGGNNYDIHVKNNGNAYLANVLFDSTRVFCMDPNGVPLWRKSLYGNIYSIDITTGSDIYAAGELDEKLLVVKADSTFMVRGIILKQPQNNQNVKAFQNFDIEWYQSNIENVNIKYSYDDGISWHNIVSNLGAEAEIYNWIVPNTFSDKCFIKITDESDTEKYVMNSEPFQIIDYQEYEYLAINEIKMWVGNNGSGSHKPNTDSGGFNWPSENNFAKSLIYEDGLVYGGKVNDEIRVNGNTHRQGLTPGKILGSGEPDDPIQSKYKVYKVREDWEYFPPGNERDKLEYNYNHWPVEAGAPFEDNNNDGVYDPNIDSPYFIGNGVLYYVANDLDTAASVFTYGSFPIGLEFQTLVWGYSFIPFLDDVVFKKYTIINKSETTIEDMYLTYWGDCDLGNPTDDFTGCDTNLNLGYVYNGKSWDDEYLDSSPPAVGHMILQGPIIPGELTDTAVFNGKRISGYKNLPMTSFVYYDGSYFSPNKKPQLGNYDGTLEFYNNMQGKRIDGSVYIDPITSEETVFPLSGDPETESGWYESEEFSWGFRGYVITSGPFNLPPGAKQEIVYAIFAAQGTNFINSVTELKNRGAEIRQYFNDVLVNVAKSPNNIVSEFNLYQNYPNPFNSTTIIEFKVPGQKISGKRSEQRTALPTQLIIYDILGREIKTLINKLMKPGSYKVQFDASGLSTGVYFYKIISGEYSDIKKMIYIK
ncbi:MAG: T9SS type A sorting domain-containing protein [Melioribacteraceae bacterium]|nr:T9SS type A sorting domain-containing protein [Melioribacteraceae bacterium]MCF8353358.1 T9SS type A sorting domain-containing protein [Melioribacteraceae bacterium]MCF8393222.1 T9SS type A sorting domain-containing protein [Melioribacteraceae bacterium]MCF8419084.1 T9SS type A sorting domain-containing protein [Melioribacteraceae bacterium]